jgi:non-heme chloroperoxidase
MKFQGAAMNTIQVNESANGQPVELFYQDLGSGSPVVLIHGWPASHAMWEYQMLELPNHGLRVIAYDRRGFGQSSKPWDGYDYDTMADDLKGLLDGLDLENVTLVGFSMGGGEVARYMARHGGARVAKVVFVSAVTPFLLKTIDNPGGIDRSVFEPIYEGLKKDRPDFLTAFGKQFFNVGLLAHPVSDATLNWMQDMALPASPKATLDCAHAFAETDFREDLKKISVPALVIHGTDDQTVPIAVSGARTVELLGSAQYRKYSGSPHGLFVTDKDELNRDLIDFIVGK